MDRLGTLAPGARGVIQRLDKGERAYRAKLLSMGITPGTEFEVLRVAPMGDPIEIRIRGFKLSLRRAEADIVLVQLTDSRASA